MGPPVAKRPSLLDPVPAVPAAQIGLFWRLVGVDGEPGRPFRLPAVVRFPLPVAQRIGPVRWMLALVLDRAPPRRGETRPTMTRVVAPAVTARALDLNDI
jgi:hypothetical protein